jgi:glycosyltransferase 2 family protein
VKPPEGRSARALQVVAGVAISAALVWLAFRNEPFSDVWAIIKTARVLPMAAAVALATAPFALRVPRWKLLLRQHDGAPIATSSLWNAIAIGFAANNVLPLRAGEVLRVAAINRLAPVSFAAALSSVAVERVLDALVVVTLLGIGLVGGQLPASNGMAVKAEWIGVICLAAMFAAILAAWQRETALRIFERLLPTGPVATKIVGFVDNVLRGLAAMRDPRRAAPVILWSVAIWLVNASAFFLAFQAFGFAVPFAGALVLQGAVMIGIAVPSTPGYVGVLDTAIYGTLLLYGVDQAHGLAYALLYHITTFIPITLLGALSALRTGTRLRTPPAAP